MDIFQVQIHTYNRCNESVWTSRSIGLACDARDPNIHMSMTSVMYLV